MHTTRISSGYPRQPDQRSNSSSSSPSEPPDRYENSLWQWAGLADPQKVFSVIMGWVQKGDPELELDLSGLNLEMLPPLPAGVKKLNASHNHITGIEEELPATLVDLKLNNNRLLQVPRLLPWETLNSLDLANNRITHLPSEIVNVNPVCELRLKNNPVRSEVIEAIFDTFGDVSRLKLGFAMQNYRQGAALKVPFPPRFRNRVGENLLVMAIDRNRSDKVAQLLGHGEIDLNYRDQDINSTPLVQATMYGYTKIVRMLCLDPRTDPNLPAQDGSPPLNVALAVAPLELASVDALLNHPAIKPNLRNAKGRAPLHQALLSHDQELLARLLDHPKVDPNVLFYIEGSRPLSPLSMSLVHAPEMAAPLLAHPAIDVNADNAITATTQDRESTLGWAVIHKRSELILPLIEKGAWVNQDMESGALRSIASAVGKHDLETLIHGSKKDANALLKRLYELPPSSAPQGLINLAFRLAAMAWYSPRAAESAELFSDNQSGLQLKQSARLNNVITMRALPREQWWPVLVEVSKWLQILGGDGPKEALLNLPRKDLPALTRQILEAWNL